MNNLDIKKLYYQAYLSGKDLKENELINFSIKDRLEHNLFFYALKYSEILKDLNLEYSSLDLNDIKKSERPDFKLIHQDKTIGVEIKNFGLHRNIANRIIEKIKLGISYEDLKRFIEKEDKENSVKYIECIETDEKNKPIGFHTNSLNLDNSIEKCIKFIVDKVKNAITYPKIDSLFLAFAFCDEVYALNLLDGLLLDERISKYERYYEKPEHGKLILKIY